jgi:hypothetical protein
MGYGPTKSFTGDPNWGDRPVQFRHADAQRIAAAVHKSETGRTLPKGSRLPRSVESTVQYAVFTGGWFKGEFKVVTVGVDSATTHTASVHNALFNLISYSNTTARSCFVSGGFLLNADCVSQ